MTSIRLVSVLSKYIPDTINHVTGDDYIRSCVLDNVADKIVSRGTLNHTDASYYVYRRGRDLHEKALSATAIIDSIDWEALPESHQYHRTQDGSEHDPDDWPLIRYYARRRGILVHHYCLRDGSSSYTEIARDEFSDSPPGDASHRDVHEAASEWRHAPRVPAPDEEILFDVGEEALAERCVLECYDAGENWDQINRNTESMWIADESLVYDKTDDDHPYGGQIDRLTAIEDGPVSSGVYAIEIKLADDWHPRHLVQAESYRRTLTDHIPDLKAAVIRLGVDEGDWEIISSHDDRWYRDELWSIFCRRAERLYEDSLYQIALENSGR